MSDTDIDSLIAAARERHRESDATAHRSGGRMAALGLCACDAPWPCPDRILIDALAPVYEAAKEAVEFFENEFITFDNGDGRSLIETPMYNRHDEITAVLVAALERNPR